MLFPTEDSGDCLGGNSCPTIVCPRFAFRNAQHTPVILIVVIIRISIHDPIAEHAERRALQWLGKEIGNHLLRRAVFNRKLVVCNPVCDEEISDVYVPGSLATGEPTILFHQHGALVVLVHD